MYRRGKVKFLKALHQKPWKQKDNEMISLKKKRIISPFGKSLPIDVVGEIFKK